MRVRGRRVAIVKRFRIRKTERRRDKMQLQWNGLFRACYPNPNGANCIRSYNRGQLNILLHCKGSATAYSSQIMP